MMFFGPADWWFKILADLVDEVYLAYRLYFESPVRPHIFL